MELYGAPGTGPTTSYFAFANAGGGTLTITAAAGSAAFLSASVYSPTIIAITANAAGLAPGTYHGNVTITSNAANNAAVAVPVDFIVTAAATPNISPSGIVNPSTYVSEPFAPGEVIAAFGTLFASAGTAATNPGPPPLQMTLGGTQVLVNGVPAPLYYVSPTQINFQVPYSYTAGQTATVQVVSGGVPGNMRPITIASNSPRMLELSSGYLLAFNLTDGSLPLPSSMPLPPYAAHPAKPGDILEMFAVGFGQTSPPAVEGQPATASPLEYAATTTVSFGGGPFAPPPVAGNVLFTGLSPTGVGLYQINVTVPPNAPLGSSIPVNVTVAAAPRTRSTWLSQPTASRYLRSAIQPHHFFESTPSICCIVGRGVDMPKKKMMMVVAVLVGLAAVRSLVPLASAAPRMEAGIKQTMQLLVLMETDPSGQVSKAEFMKFMEAEFDKLDKNKDGELDAKELTQSQYSVHVGTHR